MKGALSGVEGYAARFRRGLRKFLNYGLLSAILSSGYGCTCGSEDESPDSAPEAEMVFSEADAPPVPEKAAHMSFPNEGAEAAGGFVEVESDEGRTLFRSVEKTSAGTIEDRVALADRFNTIAEVYGCGRSSFASVREKGGQVFVEAICGGVPDYVKIDRTHPVVQRGIITKRLGPGFVDAVQDMCQREDMHCHGALSVMDFVTDGTFRPDYRRSGSSAVGLGMFSGNAAKGLGTSTDALAGMDQLEQFLYVWNYFKSPEFQGIDFSNPDNIALAVIMPDAIGDLDLVLASKRGNSKLRGAYSRLQRFDPDSRGRVTARDIVRQALDRGYLSYENRLLCFPLGFNSVRTKNEGVRGVYGLSDNFASRRQGGRRKHKAIDIYTVGKGRGIAIDDGVVVSTSTAKVGTGDGVFYTCEGGELGDGGDVGFVQVYHPHLHITALYGEVDTADADRFRIGQRITKGTLIGHFRGCGMIHFEVMRGRYDGVLYHNWPSNQAKHPDLENPFDMLVTLAKRGWFCSY
ncbi:hypothetical protein KY362_04235 [Candidatus Woesearchaeota archaeon]|nr:hypothetical protein [Candidatus Woesearchaeota archaeon]